MSEIATKITPADELCLTISKMEPQYKNALPPQVTPARFVRVAQTAIRMTPKLIECDKASLYGALLRCAQSGLLPDGQEAAIVPWGGKARFMPMVKGLCKQARNSGEIRSIAAQIVYENDSYEAWEDEQGPHFKFKKTMTNRGNPLLTYAYAITKDGGFYFEEILEEEMAKIEKQSKAEDSPWKGPFRDEMKKKSTIRRLLKYRVPSSTDLDALVREEDDLFELKQENKEPKEQKKSRLEAIVETSMVEDKEEQKQETPI